MDASEDSSKFSQIFHIIDLICGMNVYRYNSSYQNMDLKLNRQIHSNFQVCEILPGNTILSDYTGPSPFGKPENGLFWHYILRKNGIDTPQAIQNVAQKYNIPSDWIGYAGLKDAQAITWQRISIWSPTGILYPSIENENFSVFGGTRKLYEVNLGDLQGNHFKIALDKSNIAINTNALDVLLQSIVSIGVPNFYGSQRFGSVRPISHLIGKALLQKNWEAATLAYLGVSSTFEPEYIQSLRQEFFVNHDPEPFLKQLPKKYFYERKMAKQLVSSNNFQKVIFSLPKRVLALFVNAYQSFIFNWIVSKLLREYNPTDNVPSFLPIIGSNTVLEDFPSWIKDEVEILLSKDKLTLQSFDQDETWIHRKGAIREIFLKPMDFKHYYAENQLILEFSLPQGSYATVILRELLKNDLDAKQLPYSTYDEYNMYIKRFLLFPDELFSLND